MLTITEKAKEEIENRFSPSENQFIKLHFTGSCSMRLKASLVDVKEDDDLLFTIDELQFIIPKFQAHYFNNKTLEFIKDRHGFTKFELLEQ